MKEPPQTYLDNAVSQLARAWSRRSPAERSAFADRLAAVSAPPGEPDSALLTVRERAALCGAVTPSDLTRGLDPDEASRALDLLAPEFDRVHAADRWTWTLRTAPRQRALATLVESGRLPDRLAEVAVIRTDRAGEILRQLAEIRSRPQDEQDSGADSVPEGDPATVVQALTWARPFGGFEGDLAEAQRRAAVRSLSDGYGVLTRHGVFGREHELAELREFAAGSLGAEKSGVLPVPLLLLTGIGGAGKSTVLGALVQPYLARIEEGDPAVPAVVLLDFDRVQFRPTADLELSFELTRQLGYASPAAAADFSALRRRLRDEQRQSGSDKHVSNVRSDSVTREASAFEHDAGELIRQHKLQDRPVLLVLDTFEEWQRERLYPDMNRTPWNAPDERILDWIRRIHFGMRLGNLRVIISGRASLGDAGGISRPGGRLQLVVGDLDIPSARELLGALGVAAPDAATIVGFVGRDPLTLHIAARFYRGLDGPARRQFLADAPQSGAGLTVDIRKEVLYGRFLAHIPDEQVRKLAHPGLLLRRVTPELVQDVLAGPCGLGELDEGQARRLTRRLADEVWLVQETPNGVYHRRDVRGPMLKLMAGDPDYADVTRQIHAAAVSWYESNGDGRDPLSPDQARAEALYHSLMLAAGDKPVAPERDPDRQRWLQAAQALGMAVDELPERVAAQIRVLRGDQIRDRDGRALPDPVWQLWIEQRGRALVDNGEPTAALDLLDTRPSSVRPTWLAQACSDAGQWGRYWRIARGLSGHGQADTFSFSGRYALLDALLSEDRDDLIYYQAALSRYFSERPEADAAAPGEAERLFCSLLCYLGIPAGQPTTPLPPAVYRAVHASIPAVSDQDVVDHFPVDQLRRMTTWIASPSGDPDFVIENAASFCRPDPRWMRDFAVLAGIRDRGDLGSYLARLGRSVGEGTPVISTHELLGEWSIGYARALGHSPIELRRSQVRESADLIHVLRGDNPELRPAIQLALAGPAAGVGIRDLAFIALRLVPVRAADLRPQAFTGGPGGDRRTLIQLVEYVDRSGVMREFLTEARRAWPEAELLQRVADAFGIWDDANNRLLDALADRLRNERG